MKPKINKSRLFFNSLLNNQLNNHTNKNIYLKTDPSNNSTATQFTNLVICSYYIFI